MASRFDMTDIEQRVLSFFQRLSHFIGAFFKSAVSTATAYVRGKTRHVPFPLPKGRREILEDILERKQIQDFLHDFSRQCGMSLEQVENSFRGYLKEISADLNYLWMPFWDFLLTWVFDTIYEGLEVDLSALNKIRELQKRLPVVFVPNHRSHMDYLVLSYVLHLHSIPVPFICAGANLSFWPLGPMFRKSGAFFIRRSYEGNKLYAAAIDAYIEQLIREKSCVEFFIEGTRSRTGKLLRPRMGILKSVVEAYQNGASEDVLLIPTSFTYDSVLEEKSYVDERAGVSKKDENIWDLFRIRKYLRRRKGKVYVEFGDPISLKDFFGQFPAEDDSKARLTQLASDITHGINKSTVVTPASLSATALLTQTSRAVTETAMSQDADRYLDYLDFKGCHLSEPLQKYRTAAVRESLKNYVRSHLVEEFHDREEPLYRLMEEKRPLLDYYKNTSIHFFVSLGALATTLQVVSGEIVPIAEVEDGFRFIQDVFRNEFTFSRRQDLKIHLDRLWEFLEKKGWVRREGDSVRILSRDFAFYARPLRNFLEAYGVLWKTLPEMGQRRWEMKDFLKFLGERGRILYLREEIEHPESVNRFTFQNAIATFKETGFLKEETEGWGKKKRTFLTIGDMSCIFTDHSHLWINRLFNLQKNRAN